METRLKRGEPAVRSGAPYRVAFYVYPTAFQSPGGGEIMLLKTKEYLEKAGVTVKLLDPWSDKLSSFDILHTFGSVKDCLPMIRSAKDQGILTVLSTVCWYSWSSAWGIPTTPSRRFMSLLQQAAKEIFPAFPSERRKMMLLSDLLMPNSEAEARQLVRYFRVPRDRIRVIPNAVDEHFAGAAPDLFVQKYGLRDFILTVGRIEPRKNQLNVIRALNGTGKTLVLIGDYVPQYKSYYERCRKEAGPDVHFLGPMPHESELLKSAYAACNTFLLATWLETPGLAALEAALAGAKVVITREGATREYFEDFVAYVNPASPRDIRRRTLEMFGQDRSAGLREHVRSRYSWTRTAELILEAYAGLMEARKSRT